MDLRAESERLQLDVLAVRISRALDDAGVGHVLLKGPSTSLWLYDPPRPYRDVDVLVARSTVTAACRALAAAGLASASAGALGEEAGHSLLLLSAAGFEVDLHVSLPTLPPRGDRLWRVLSGYVEHLELDVGTVPVLDEPARCVVLALHALGNAASPGQALEDLRRARARSSPPTWAAAARIAADIGAGDLFDAGVALLDGRPAAGARSVRSRLYATGAPRGAIGLQRIAEAPLAEVGRLIGRELLPSRGFLRRATGDDLDTVSSLAAAHLHRWRSHGRELPRAVRAWRAAHRS